MNTTDIQSTVDTISAAVGSRADEDVNIIEMIDICKVYNLGKEHELHVLKNVNFTLKQGEFVAICGPSGSGKSTLMNIVGCMDKFTSGSYTLAGSLVDNLSDRELTELRNREVGFVFQKYHLIPQYNVLQNIVMPLLIRGNTLEQATESSREIIELLGMDDRLTHKPSELSGGQQQRVAIARALVGHPHLLLADEPTGALDSETGREVLSLFKKLHERGNTILMITHDQGVAKYAERVIQIIDGELFEE